jgi:hypothetical protein
MNPFRSSRQHRVRRGGAGPRVGPALERLEDRALLTGGAGDTFAVVAGTIARPGGTAAVHLTIDQAHFRLPRQAFTLGVDVAPDAGSGLLPLIASVDDPHGNLIPQTFTSIYDPHLSHLAVASGQATRAALTPVSFFPGAPGKPATYTANVEAQGNSSGSFHFSFYLPGDANGDGVVNQADLRITERASGSRAGQARYNANADVNRDGRIGKIDISYVEQNMGVRIVAAPQVGIG